MNSYFILYIKCRLFSLQHVYVMENFPSYLTRLKACLRLLPLNTILGSADMPWSTSSLQSDHICAWVSKYLINYDGEFKHNTCIMDLWCKSVHSTNGDFDRKNHFVQSKCVVIPTTLVVVTCRPMWRRWCHDLYESGLVARAWWHDYSCLHL